MHGKLFREWLLFLKERKLYSKFIICYRAANASYSVWEREKPCFKLLNGCDYIIQDKKGYKEKEVKLGEEINILGGLTINNFEIHGGTADYRYKEKNCTENCQEYTKRIQPNLNEKLLELNVKYESNDINNKLLDYYVSLEYEKDGKTYYNKAKKMKLLDYVTLDDGQRLYYSINSDLPLANKKYLVITTRDVKYKVLLQEENE